MQFMFYFMTLCNDLTYQFDIIVFVSNQYTSKQWYILFKLAMIAKKT